jgi:hypothetical protein
MKMKRSALFLCTVLAGIASGMVTLYGVYSALAVDLQQDTLLIGLYCLLPILSFPAFILIRPRRRGASVLGIFALAYLAVYSALNWRTCSELNYCSSLLSTVRATLMTRVTLIYFAAVVLSFATAYFDRVESASGRNVL